MQLADADKFRNLLRGMGRMYGSDLDALVLDAYWIALGDWGFEDFQAACAHLMAGAKFMPKPADFNALRKAAERTAGEVWGDVRRFLQYTPFGYKIADGTPPRIAASIAAIGGANAIAFCDADKLHFLERRFCEHYETIGEAREIRESVPAIAGPMAQLTRDAVKRLTQ